MLYRLEKDDAVDPKHIEDIGKLKVLINSETVLPTDLLMFRRLFRRYLDFYQFDTTTQMKIFHFMTIDPVTGFNTINRFLNIFKMHIPLESAILRPYLRLILGR
jgi:hypothetical protein